MHTDHSSESGETLDHSLLSEVEVKRQGDALRLDLPVDELYEAVTDLVVVLNAQRQIVYANQNFLNSMELTSLSDAQGKRVGEWFGCIRSNITSQGCGSSEFCQECVAFHAICSGLKGVPDARECRILLNEVEGSLELWVRSTPLTLRCGKFVVVSLNDISNQKRRAVLERIFFHDLINTAGGIRGLVQILQDADPHEQGDYLRMLNESSEQMLDEIRSQRLLMRAENGELAVHPEEIFLAPMVDGIRNMYLRHEVGMGKQIYRRVDQLAAVTTDRALLHRVLSNMVKNALEASSMKHPVTIRVEMDKEKVRLEVHNESVMPQEVRRQVFQRSFSTKGAGRGIGTYSMRLLSSRYLQGTVSFSSTPEHGTVFRLEIPLVLGDTS